MKRISSVKEFIEFRSRIVDQKKAEPLRPCLVICAGTGGQASGSNDIMRIIKRYILEKNLQEKISLRVTGCQGFCEMDPFILVEPGRNLYPKVNREDVSEIIDAAIEGKIVSDLLYREKGREKKYHLQEEIPFFEKQTRTILGKNQLIDPIRVHDYIENGGYAAFEKVVSKPDPEWIIKEVQDSGLRGRGGAGFPTGKKWKFANKSGSASTGKYIVCNADEGDPGAYMDRSLLEGNPHAIIEGMIIAGIAIGAAHGIIYVRSEYPLAIKHARIAIRQANDIGILGTDIMGTGIDFNIEIVRGAGAFVCGEETALIKSIEGFIGEPRQRPPYPIQKGIDGKPTCINNVETLANIPVIINKGAKEYAKVGVPGNTGTKIFSLVGKIRNTGLVEVPLGMKISEVVYHIGGGPPGNAKIKAVQTGGPSGGCIPASMFDLPIDYESLAGAGAIMGSGGMIVMDENTCMIDLAKYFMNFLKDESCGKCYTCRKGTQRMYEILEDISNGNGTLEQLDLLEELALVVKDTTMCGLGQTAPNPVLSTLKYYRDEYLEHINNKRCPAGVCKQLVGAPCQDACPLGTEAWRYVANIESGKYEEAYRVIREPNPLPSVCARVCNHPCEERCRAGTTGGEPVAIRSLKRFITDSVDPSVYKPRREAPPGSKDMRVAVVGSGPAGLSAAHCLSLKGYKVTVFEKEDRPGGMLVSAIPAYRLPRDVLDREIDSLLDESVELKCNTSLGSDITVDGLFKQEGFKAVFLAAGAHRSMNLGLDEENIEGVIPALKFLKDFNLREMETAKGHVGVIGGGNSAVDAARVALRQKGVESVTIFYRRTRREMPAYEEEIQDALEEGVNLETLVSPEEIKTENGQLKGVTFITNKLGEVDNSGRRRPVPSPGTEKEISLDTLLVAIGERPDTEGLSDTGISINRTGSLKVDSRTLSTNQRGVFAGGDLVTGPNTVVEAIAAGKKAALMIDRYLTNQELIQPVAAQLPEFYVEPAGDEDQESTTEARAHPARIPVKDRRQNFSEVEKSLSEKEARCEARRCLRCDLEFTKAALEQKESLEKKGRVA